MYWIADITKDKKKSYYAQIIISLSVEWFMMAVEAKYESTHNASKSMKSVSFKDKLFILLSVFAKFTGLNLLYPLNQIS